ncbi:ABC transporter substrate-binding protein [Phaeobacter sp. HF9A]|uniref:ABC transporter substrate-binding protein n=1 Tax=Phaeobacter sp. HF9A TaxID=2721561 RepID=UPI001430B0DF|nr:ABC transporter substrate-binding protein [Phaeobacter sp. HF9A]NIZ11853.1 peptide ABC transporter substrate-binding protein [Phaeobacter sp. HF9A]
MKRLDRRALFASGAAAALLAATGASLSQQPRRGGTLRLAVPRDGDLLTRVARSSVYDQLTEVAPDGLLRGELAQDWHSEDGARRWVLDLRRDAMFHDGRKLAAADVVASLEGHARQGELQLTGLKNIEETPDGGVLINLAEGNPHLPYHLAKAGLGIAPDGSIDAPLGSMVGTGLYSVERAQEGRHFRASRRQQHYKDGRAGWVEALDLIVIPDAAVRAEALREGYVDVAALPLPSGIVGRGSFHVHPTEGDLTLAAGQHVALPTRISARAPLDDYRIAERWWMA